MEFVCTIKLLTVCWMSYRCHRQVAPPRGSDDEASGSVEAVVGDVQAARGGRRVYRSQSRHPGRQDVW